MLTTEMIRKIAPRARQDYIDALVGGKAVFEKYGINTPTRMAHFLAQVTHETGGLTIVRENMNYTAKRIGQVWPSRPEAKKFANNPQGLANCVYNGRMGNRKGSNDGWLFRGASFMQTTGRDNYERLEKETGLPFASKPETIEDPRNALVAACWELAKFCSYADKGEKGLRAVSNGINRGNPASSQLPIGWTDRQLCYQKAVNALGACEGPRDDILELGDDGEAVEALQARLMALGYVVGKVDGVFGPRVRAAVLAFQAENDLPTDGRAGPQTLAVLNSDQAQKMPIGDRANEGVAELKAAGSTTVAVTSMLKTGAKVATVTSAGFATADSTGLLDSVGSLMTDLKQLQGVTGEVVNVITWGASYWYFGVPLVAYLIWYYANKLEVRRVLEHQLGINLNR
jgi:putative chitinase